MGSDGGAHRFFCAPGSAHSLRRAVARNTEQGGQLTANIV